MKILLNAPIFDGIFNLAKSHKIEWTAYATARQTNRNQYLIEDIIIPYQENASGTTEVPTEAIDPDKTQKFDATLEWRTRDRKLKDPQTWRGPEWNVWIHSHNTMQAFWSGTDWEEIENMMKERETPFVTIVVNASSEYEALFAIPKHNIIVKAEIERYEPSISDIIKDKNSKTLLESWENLIKKTANLQEELNNHELITETPIYYKGYTGYYNQQNYSNRAKIDYNWMEQASFTKELAKNQQDLFFVAETNQSLCPDSEEGWYECDKNGLIVKPIKSSPFQERTMIKKRGNVIMYLDEYLAPVGIYSGYKSSPYHFITKYNELFKDTITDQTAQVSTTNSVGF